MRILGVRATGTMEVVELKKDGKTYEMNVGQLKTTNIALLFGVSTTWTIRRPVPLLLQMVV